MMIRSALTIASLLILSTFAVAASPFAWSAPQASASQDTVLGRHAETITVDGTARTYTLILPKVYDGKKSLPLVLVLHGRGGDSKQAEDRYGFSELAEKEKFIVCYPEALKDGQGQTTWNAVLGAGDKADDVAFLENLIQHLKTTLKVDEKRVYVCGHSSGAMMTYRFGAEHGAELAAIGVVAGTIGSDYGTDRSVRIAKPTALIPLIAFHGKADPIVPYDWRNGTGGASSFHFVPAPESVQLFVEANGDDKTPKRETSFGGNVVEETFTDGKKGSEVVFYSIGDGNHKWPGATYTKEEEASSYGPPNKQINATTLLWEFFKKHSR